MKKKGKIIASISMVILLAGCLSFFSPTMDTEVETITPTNPVEGETVAVEVDVEITDNSGDVPVLHVTNDNTGEILAEDILGDREDYETGEIVTETVEFTVEEPQSTVIRVENVSTDEQHLSSFDVVENPLNEDISTYEAEITITDESNEEVIIQQSEIVDVENNNSYIEGQKIEGDNIITFEQWNTDEHEILIESGSPVENPTFEQTNVPVTEIEIINNGFITSTERVVNYSLLQQDLTAEEFSETKLDDNFTLDIEINKDTGEILKYEYRADGTTKEVFFESVNEEIEIPVPPEELVEEEEERSIEDIKEEEFESISNDLEASIGDAISEGQEQGLSDQEIVDELYEPALNVAEERIESNENLTLGENVTEEELEEVIDDFFEENL